MRITYLSVLALMALSALALPARADLQISESTDNFSYSTLGQASSGTAATFNGAISGFALTLNDSSNSPGLSTVSDLDSGGLIMNDTSATSTLYLAFSDTGFLSPVAPPDLSLDVSVSGIVIATGPANTLSVTTYVDPLDGQNSQSGTSAPTLTPDVTGISSMTFHTTDTTTDISSGLSGPYSITEIYRITLDPGSDLSFNGNSTLSQIPTTSTSVPLAASAQAAIILGSMVMAGKLIRRPRAA